MAAGRCLALLAAAAFALGGCAISPARDDSAAIARRAAHYALSMKGTPYRYGGSTPAGFDCSGLVQYSYARAGARVPRTTRGLWRASRAVPLARIRPGDLLFFNPEGKRFSHVGLYLGDGRFVHAPSSGRTVSVANLQQPYWRHHFAGARRPRLE